MFSFAAGAARVMFRLFIEKQPENQPGKTKSAGQQERPSPAEMVGNPRDNEGSNDGADIGAGVEDTSR